MSLTIDLYPDAVDEFFCDICNTGIRNRARHLQSQKHATCCIKYKRFMDRHDRMSELLRQAIDGEASFFDVYPEMYELATQLRAENRRDITEDHD